MIDFVRGILIVLVFFFSFGCGRSGKGVQLTSDAEQLRQYALNCLSQDKTYTLENGFDEAIEHYISKGDTAAVLEMCRFAAVRMQWLNQQDSAATYPQYQ